MARVLIRRIGSSPLQLTLRAAAHGITLAPGSSWTDHVIVVTGSDSIAWPEVIDAGPTPFAGIPVIPPAVPGPLPAATWDAAWLAAASGNPMYTWVPEGWRTRPTERSVGARTAVRLQRSALSRAAVIRHRADMQTRWLVTIADNPVVPGAVSRLTPQGDAMVVCADAHRVLLPSSEEVRRHAPGDRLVMRLTTSLGGWATERDERLLRGLARRVVGADYCDPVLDVWPTWAQAPRLAFVLAPRHRYQSWVSAAATLTALSGRRIRSFRDATPPLELVRQALRLLRDGCGPCVLCQRAGGGVCALVHHLWAGAPPGGPTRRPARPGPKSRGALLIPCPRPAGPARRPARCGVVAHALVASWTDWQMEVMSACPSRLRAVRPARNRSRYARTFPARPIRPPNVNACCLLWKRRFGPRFNSGNVKARTGRRPVRRRIWFGGVDMSKMAASTPMRAVALLRVSTARQAAKHRSDEETLPVQREAVRRFAAAHGWQLVREFSEEGVSAWKNSSADRPVLQELLDAGRRHEFDVLIVFKADRLSRQSLEYPMVLHTLRRFGIATWTVVDDGTGRELTVDTPIDRLMRFIEGFQGESESASTSVRVLATMKRMAEQGRWTGGPAPYGFRATGLHGGPALPLAIDAAEAAVVREIYRLYLAETLGSPTIARRLNEAGARMRNGKPWHDTAVRGVLASTMVAGRPVWGRHYRDRATGHVRQRPLSDPAVIIAPESLAEWTIVSWEDFERAQARRAAWQPRQYQGVDDRTRAESSALLLTGLLRCAACGGSITAGHAAPTKVLKDGTRVRYRYPRYICRNHYAGLPCSGQRTYSVRKLDQLVIRHVRGELERLDSQDAYQDLQQRLYANTFQQRQQLELATRRREQQERLEASWVARLNQHFLDPETSRYDESFLADRVAEARAGIAAAQQEIDRLTRQGGGWEERLAALDRFQRLAPTFGQDFLRWDRATQKRTLRHLLERVVVSSEGLDIHWRLDLAAILADAAPLTPVTWRSQVMYAATP